MTAGYGNKFSYRLTSFLYVVYHLLWCFIRLSTPPPPSPVLPPVVDQTKGGTWGFIYILLWQTMLIVTNDFDLVFNLFMFLVVLKGRAIVCVPKLVLRNPLIHISSALCCYTCDTCVWSTQINLEPLISNNYFSRPWTSFTRSWFKVQSTLKRLMIHNLFILGGRTDLVIGNGAVFHAQSPFTFCVSNKAD